MSRLQLISIPFLVKSFIVTLFVKFVGIDNTSIQSAYVCIKIFHQSLRYFINIYLANKIGIKFIICPGWQIVVRWFDASCAVCLSNACTLLYLDAKCLQPSPQAAFFREQRQTPTNKFVDLTQNDTEIVKHGCKCTQYTCFSNKVWIGAQGAPYRF